MIFSEVQLQIRDAARAFAQKEIVPHAAEWDSQTFETWKLANVQTQEARDLVDLAFSSVFAAEPRDVSLLFTLFYIATAGGFDNLINAAGGAQERFGITPDLTCLGKIIGGGMPVGAYGGREEIMRMIAPDGPVYQAGTLSGNPLAMRAGLETLTRLRVPGFYESLEAKSAKLFDGLLAGCKAAGIPATGNRFGSMFTVFFTDADACNNYQDVCGCDLPLLGRFFNAMLDEGVYLAPSQFEAAFVSAAHSDSDIEATIAAASRALAGLSA